MSLCGDIIFGNDMSQREDVFEGNGNILPELIREHFQDLIDEKFSDRDSGMECTHELSYSTVVLFKEYLLQVFANITRFDQIGALFDYSYQMMYNDIRALEKAVAKHDSVRICWSW